MWLRLWCGGLRLRTRPKELKFQLRSRLSEKYYGVVVGCGLVVVVVWLWLWFIQKIRPTQLWVELSWVVAMNVHNLLFL